MRFSAHDKKKQTLQSIIEQDEVALAPVLAFAVGLPHVTLHLRGEIDAALLTSGDAADGLDPRLLGEVVVGSENVPTGLLVAILSDIERVSVIGSVQRFAFGAAGQWDRRTRFVVLWILEVLDSILEQAEVALLKRALRFVGFP